VVGSTSAADRRSREGVASIKKKAHKVHFWLGPKNRAFELFFSIFFLKEHGQLYQMKNFRTPAGAVEGPGADLKILELNFRSARPACAASSRSLIAHATNTSHAFM
jgi:hypothetical protein